MNSVPTEPHSVKADTVIFALTKDNLRRLLAAIRLVLAFLTVTYAGALLLLLAGLEWVGERFWPFGILLYAPPQTLLLPLLLLTPCCLLFHWRLCLWHLACAAFFFFFFMTCRFTSPPGLGAGEITALTFNQGQGSRTQFMSFAAEVQPDLILLQDAQWHVRDFEASFPGSSVSAQGEFILVSKFPIQRAAVLDEPRGDARPVAARFEVLAHGRPLAIYSVHLPTPRQQLSRFLGGRRLLGDLAGYGRHKAVYGDYRGWLQARVETARGLAAVFAAEKLPFIVGGDFNTPDHGYIYHLFAGELTDAFAKAGRGWGLTFPGTTRNPVAFFGPWLRIDYFFAGHGWRPVECRPEDGRKSQHRAVFARFAPAPNS